MWLNKPFSPFLDLLTLPGTYICSPVSTPKYQYFNLTTGYLIGTGPFIYLRFKDNGELRFKRWERYWQTGPWAENLIFRIIEDDTDYINTAYNGEFDYIIDGEKFPPTFCFCPPPFEIIIVGEDIDYFYLEFYCGSGNPIYSNPWNYQVLNSTWRRALALTINYSYLYNEILLGFGGPGYPAVSSSIPGYNDSVITTSIWQDIYGYNNAVKKARELMQSMGYGLGWNTSYPGSDEDLWTTASFRTLEVNQHSGSLTNLQLNKLIGASWDLIGVNISVTTRTLEEYLSTGENEPWEMEISYRGWCCPDYLDAFNILNPLFNNESKFCFSHISDPVLKNALKAAAETIDTIPRQNIYKWIQSYIFDITRSENPSSCCHIPLWTYLVGIGQAHMPYLKGVAYNVLKMLNCWNWYIEY